MNTMNYTRFIVDLNCNYLGMGRIHNHLQLDYMPMMKGQVLPLHDIVGLQW